MPVRPLGSRPLPVHNARINLSAIIMSLYRYTLPGLAGQDIPLARHQGQVLLLVNTASACGFTPQFAGLQALHEAYAARGLSIIGSPCNQFGHQEPGDAAAIGAFCQKNYGVSFLMSAKLEVNGKHAHPLWQYLQQARPGLLGSRRIKWNFTKFLVDREGQVVARFGPRTPPEALRSAIEALL